MNKKKRRVLTVYLVVGLGISGLSCFLRYRDVEYYSSLTFGLGIGLVISSLWNLFLEYRHTRPEHIAEYERKQQEQRINLKDERKQYLRYLSGYRTFQIFAVGEFLLAGILPFFRAPAMFSVVFFGLAVVQYAVATVIYKRLCSRQ